MRNILLATALALGVGFTGSGAQAAALSNAVAEVGAATQADHSLIEKTDYREGYGDRYSERYNDRYNYSYERPYWHHRHHWRPRPFGYSYEYRPHRHHYYYWR